MGKANGSVRAASDQRVCDRSSQNVPISEMSLVQLDGKIPLA